MRAAEAADGKHARGAFDLCGCIQHALLTKLGADTVCKSRNSFADALFTQGLMALMPPTILVCEGAVCTRVYDFGFMIYLKP